MKTVTHMASLAERVTCDSGIVKSRVEKISSSAQLARHIQLFRIHLTPEEVPWYGRCDSDVMNKENEKYLQRRLLEGGKESIYCILYTVHVSPSGVQNLCPDVCLTGCHSGNPSLKENVLRRLT